MTIDEMHAQVRMLSQKMGQQTTRLILPEQIDIAINIAINKFIVSEFVPIRTKLVSGVSSSIINFSKLAPLIKRTKINTVYVNGSETYITLPLDYMFILNSSSKVKKDGTYVGNYSDNRLIDLETLENTISDYHSKSTVESVITYILDKNLYIETNDFTVDDIKLLYIKYPDKVSYTSATKVSCNLPDFTHDDIVNGAVNILNAITNNDSYEKSKNELKLE